MSRPMHRLKRVAQLNARTLPEDTPPDFEFGYIDISCVGRGALVAPPVLMSFEDAPSRARRIVRGGDTIISTVRTYLRAVWPVDGEPDRLIASTGFVVITPGPSLDPRFLGWWAQSDTCIEEIVARSVGVSYPAVNPSEVGTVQIALPTLAEQREIADVLVVETARIDALIEKKRHMIALAELRYRATIDSSIAQLRGELVRLGRFIGGITQGSSPVAANRPAEPDEWGVLKLSAVRTGEYRPSENKALDAETIVDRSLVPQAGDLLVTRSNTPDLVGDVCAVRETVSNRLLCDLIYRVRLDGRLLPEYVAYAMLTHSARGDLSSLARGTSQSMVKLRGEDIKAIAIPLADASVQLEIVNSLDQERTRFDDLRKRLESQVELLLEHRRALITGAVTGQMVAKAAA